MHIHIRHEDTKSRRKASEKELCAFVTSWQNYNFILLRYLYAFEQILIVFKAAAEQVTHKVHDLVVITVEIARLQILPESNSPDGETTSFRTVLSDI